MDHVFFWISKIAWLFISPDSLLIIWLGITVILVLFGWLLLAKWMLIGLFVVFMIVGMLPVGEWLFYPLEKRYSPNPELSDIDGIIVLGDSLERNVEFLVLTRQFPDVKLVFTGGSPSMVDQQKKSADSARKFFTRHGLDTSNIVFERDSRNTWENAVFSKKLVNPDLNEEWVLITTAWHMPRSVGVFCKVGWDVIPYPVDFHSEPDNIIRLDWDFAGHLNRLVFAVKEWIGIIVYQASGRSC